MRFTAAAAVTIAAGSLASCSSIDAEQARICRSTLPALASAGADVVVVRTLPWFEPYSIRIEFDERRDGDRSRRFAICRFATEGASRRKTDLSALSTERGPVSGASLYLLKQFYLDTPEGLSADPGAEAPSPAPEIPQTAARLLQPFLSGLPFAAIYGLLAAAYALLFGLVERINIAFGALASVGGTAAGIAIVSLGQGEITTTAGAAALLGIVVACLTATFHGRCAGAAAFQLVSARHGQASLIATVGLFLVLSEYLRIAAGNLPVWIPPLGDPPSRIAQANGVVVTMAPIGLYVTAIACLAALALPILLRFSRFGREWTAASQDRRAAELFGIHFGRLLARTFMLSGALAGLAGALIAIQFGSFGFAGGLELGLKALAAAVVGGIGSVSGALMGGVAIGLFEIVWSTYFPIAGRDVALFVILIVAILARSGGPSLEPVAMREGI